MSQYQIGRYQIKNLLGQGGMASVYLAHDPYFERDVAIKILPKEFLFDPVFRSRFEREAKTIAGMEHPAIVPVYDFGEEDGQPFLVMRLMTGGSLADRILEGPLSLADTALMIERIASGFDAAHQAGIVHRDMKPSNVLLDRRGDPYIADFGIVKLTEHSAALTGTGMIGTPSYMAPEMGDLGGVTRLVDIYALGVTVFQMLTGRLPFLADTPSGILVAHAVKPVPDPREMQPDLPPDVFLFLQTAMAKNPVERYQSAGDMAAALTALAAGESLMDSHIPMVTEAVRPERVNRVEQQTTTQLELEQPATIAAPQKHVPARLLGVSGGILGIASLALVLTRLLPFGTSVTPTQTPPVSQSPVAVEETEAAESVKQVLSTQSATSTAVSLQPMISMLFGTTEVMPDGAPTFTSLQTSQLLNKGDTIRTAPESAALLMLSPTLSIEVHPQSEIKLVELVESGGKLTVSLQQSRGVTYHILRPSSNEQSYDYIVTLPYATITATGTEFWVAEQENGWCALATMGTITIDLADPDADLADDYVSTAEDVLGWRISSANEATPCTLADLARLTESTAVPTPTTPVRVGGTTGGSTNGTADGSTTTTSSTTTGGSTAGSGTGDGTSDGSTTTDGGSTSGGSSTGGDSPPPTAPPTNTPVPPTDIPITPTITPNCGACGDGGWIADPYVNCGTSTICTCGGGGGGGGGGDGGGSGGTCNKCEKIRNYKDACGNVCNTEFIECTSN